MTIKKKIEYLQRRYKNSDIADYLGVNVRQIGLYKSGKRKPRQLIQGRINSLIELSKERKIRTSETKKKRAKSFDKAIGGILFLPPKKRRIRKSRKKFNNIIEEATIYSLIVDDDLDENKIRKLLDRGLKESSTARLGYFKVYFGSGDAFSTNISDVSILKEMDINDILGINEEKYREEQGENIDSGITRIELYLFDSHMRDRK